MIHHATYDFDPSKFEKIPNPMMSFEETGLLQDLCVGRSKVLEIGPHYGVTTANLLATGAYVTAIDVTEPPSTIRDSQGPAECLPESLICSQVPDGLRARLTLKIYNPNDPDGLVNLVRELNQQFDLIFIDGDHSIEGVARDFHDLTPCLAHDGIMVFHDCWWDVEPMPVKGPMALLTRMGGVIINKTHVGILFQDTDRLKLEMEIKLEIENTR